MRSCQPTDAQAPAEREGQAGQTLALVAVLLVGLIAMLGLVLDGGNLYLHRRRMQNAADAGALAGAREMALDHGETAAHAAAQDYAVTRNKAETATVEVKYDVGNPVVSVVAQADVHMTFARLLGIDQLEVGALAEATYGTAGEGEGVVPIALPYTTTWMTYVPFILWDSDMEAGADRGWLNLDCRGDWLPPSCGDAGSAVEKDWMRDGYPEAIEAETWIYGSSGVKGGVLLTAEVGDLLILPVYDEIRRGYPGRDYYHVVTFAAFWVDVVDRTGTYKYIEGHFEAEVMVGPISPFLDFGVRSVLLIR
jgi:hypothetical protein